MKRLMRIVTVFCFISFIFIVYGCAALERTYKRKFADMERTFVLSGFHRLIEYNVLIHNVTGATKLLIEENLPKDIFIDPYQLSKEINEGKIMVANAEKINIESPAYLAKSINIKLCSSSFNNFHKIQLPIHVRYQKPHQCYKFGENVTVKLNAPFLRFKDYVNSSPVTDCLDSTDYSSWFELKTEETETSLTVPVGCIEHFYFVLFLTCGAIILGSVMYYITVKKIRDS